MQCLLGGNGICIFAVDNLKTALRYFNEIFLIEFCIFPIIHAVFLNCASMYKLAM